MLQNMLPKSIFNMHGWCSEEKAGILYNLIKDTKPELVVELGVFGGRSFVPMALALKSNDKGICIGIDPWKKDASITNYDPSDPNYIWWNSLNHEEIFNSFKSALIHYEIEHISKYIRKTSLESLSSFEDESIDILHQDGNHSERCSTDEVLAYASKIKKGGYWIMDDTDWNTTILAQQTIIGIGFKLYEDHVQWKIFKKE